ncbi:MAG: uracil phosphoribosyltransferase [Deltaproteobacteria bacterium]|nr:uracil phosphoribosyltransferase [Deltaproteobacteria bacterium]
MSEPNNPFADAAYRHVTAREGELEHAYGPQVHILADPFLLTHLAFLCAEGTQQPAINEVVRDQYRYLIKAVLNGEFPRVVKSVVTRMAASSERGTWTGEVLDTEQRAVSVNIMRAGTLPSQVCYDFLNKTLNPKLVRQDHVVMSRMTDAAGHVTGSRFGDSKIGGDVDSAMVLFPDPMGATGGSLDEAIRYYKDKVPGRARRYVCVNLIVTPEYLRRITRAHPDVVVYAVRLDRGASSPAVLREKPGARWDEESGLTEKQYIVPGGGGFGEIMNNAYC